MVVVTPAAISDRVQASHDFALLVVVEKVVEFHEIGNELVGAALEFSRDLIAKLVCFFLGQGVVGCEFLELALQIDQEFGARKAHSAELGCHVLEGGLLFLVQPEALCHAFGCEIGTGIG